MTLIEAVKGTYAVIGQAMTDIECAMIVSDLSAYPPEAVMVALARCRRELKRITLSDIIDRIAGGHPGVEEAWAMVVRVMNDERATIVWTEEMGQAHSVASAHGDDLIAARMAFKEAYTARVSEARAQGKPVKWVMCLGWDKQQREGVLAEAVAKGRLTREEVLMRCPEITLNHSSTVKLLEEVTRALPTMPRAH